MESKLIDKINQNYSMILSILKKFLKENFTKFKINSKNFEEFEIDLLNKKGKEISNFINDYSNKNKEISSLFENIKITINDLIKDNMDNKNKIVENMKESLYLIKHPKQCLFLLDIEKYNNQILNYLKLIETQINNHKYDLIETIHFILTNIKIDFNSYK